MPHRLIEILAPTEQQKPLEAIATKAKPLALWAQSADDSLQLKVVVPSERVEPVLDALQSHMALHADVRVAVVALQAFLPKAEEEAPPEKPKMAGHTRISREELSSNLERGAAVTPAYLTTVVLSTIVAAIGLFKGSPAIIIGAMVIAPLIGPNISLAFATTLGDGKLVKKSLRTNLVGLGTAFVLALLAGLVWRLGSDFPEVVSRTKPDMDDVILALASGTAGALAFTTGVSSALVGVMVAVALLPPLVVSAMLLTRDPQAAMKAFLLLATNVICVNLAAVATFVLQGIQPRTWWDAQRSKRATRVALAVWLTLLVAVATILLYVARLGEAP